MRTFNVKVNGKEYFVEVEEGQASESSFVAAPVQEVKEAPKAAPIKGDGVKITAPMPGLVLELKVQNGTAVKKNQPIIVLEAMKMENDIVATADGVVTYAVKKGDNLNTGDVVAYIK